MDNIAISTFEIINSSNQSPSSVRTGSLSDSSDKFYWLRLNPRTGHTYIIAVYRGNVCFRGPLGHSVVPGNIVLSVTRNVERWPDTPLLTSPSPLSRCSGCMYNDLLGLVHGYGLAKLRRIHGFSGCISPDKMLRCVGRAYRMWYDYKPFHLLTPPCKNNVVSLCRSFVATEPQSA